MNKYTKADPGDTTVAAKQTVDEKARVAALKSYLILDTAPEEIFDDFVKVAATAIQAPIALISLVDDDRQWFKARVGIDITQTARAASFCTHVVDSKALLCVPDLSLDSRFRHNIMVENDPYVRFYAGAPLVSPSGHVIGTICVLDFVPREIDEADAEMLSRLSRLVMKQLEIRKDLSERVRLSKELTVAHHKLTETSALLERRFSQRTQALRVSENRFRTVVEGLEEAILITDRAGVIQYANVRISDLTGYAPQEILGLTSYQVLTTPDKWADAKTRFTTFSGNASAVWESVIRHKDGTQFWAELKTKPYLNETGTAVGTLCSVLDISERKRYQEELSHQAFCDTLTNLPNRALFLNRLERSLEADERQQKRTGLIFIDLDNFKVINDSLGHSAGDELLVQVTNRLTQCLCNQHTLARLGGDEFVILLDSVQSDREATEIAQKVAECLQKSIPLRGRQVYTTASIGVALSDGKTIDAGSLLRQADIAMYRAKADGKSSYFVFDKSMNDEAKERLELEGELRTAINGNELCLHYQPLVEMVSGKVVQIEALVRWNHPVRGLIGPGKFIPLAEESGLIVPLGLWVLENACYEASSWDRLMPDSTPMVVCVNLSTRQFHQENLVGEISEVLRKTGLPAGRLKLEITESLMMDSIDTIEKLNALKQLGIHIAVDDFGTGYSSMSYLGKFPVDTLKIDQSFISQLGRTADAQAIVEAMIMLGKALGMQVTCEGIETQFQHDALRKLDCDFGQGFHYSRPVAAHELEQVLSTISSRDDLNFKLEMAA